MSCVALGSLSLQQVTSAVMSVDTYSLSPSSYLLTGVDSVGNIFSQFVNTDDQSTVSSSSSSSASLKKRKTDLDSSKGSFLKPERRVESGWNGVAINPISLSLSSSSFEMATASFFGKQIDIIENEQRKHTFYTPLNPTQVTYAETEVSGHPLVTVAGE